MTREGPDRDAQGEEPRPLLRSFGRRRGRKLSERQDRLMADMLPKLSIDTGVDAPSSASGLFGRDVQQVWLEIGFGGAEHLLWQAVAFPDVGLIGAEPFEEGIVKALHGVTTQNLDNVRLYPDDVRPLLAWLPPATLDGVFILFPDPWPKKKHAKRRLVSPMLLKALARVVKPGGSLRLATDIASYAGDMLGAVRRDGHFAWQAEGPGDWRQRPTDWPETRYERKARREGRAPYYLQLRRR